MVNVDVDRSRVEVYEPSANNQCQSGTKDMLDRSSRLGPPSENRGSVSFSMWKDKVKVKSRRNFSALEKLQDEAARWVGYDREQYSRPFKGKSRDLKAIIAAVRFKQVVLKHSSRKKNLLKEAILANTMRRAEEELIIRGRHRQLRHAQAVAEAKAKQADSSDKSLGLEFTDDEVLQSFEQFMQSLSSVTRS